jgi:hypothetical protein
VRGVSNLVLLNNLDHADLRIAQGHGPEFGDAVNLTRVFPPEFEALQREYPIVFQPDESGSLQPVALMGLRRDENLFLDAGQWRARYVPAAHRRGPFSIAISRDAAEEPQIHVDLKHPRVVSKDGEPVFRAHGGATPYLESVRDVLGVIFDGLRSWPALLAIWTRLDLLQPVSIDLDLGGGGVMTLTDFHVLERERLMSLDAPALGALHAEGALIPAVHAASSLGNLDVLAQRARSAGVR